MTQDYPLRPRVTLHYSQTLDGRIGPRGGHAAWSGDEESERLTQELRAEHDAILIGVGTVVADNPRLTVHLVPEASPLRVVADSTLRLPLDARVLTDGAAPTLVITTDQAPSARREEIQYLGVEVVSVAAGADGRPDLGALLGHLHERGVRSVLIEGGIQIITAAFRDRLLDRLVVRIIPKLAGSDLLGVGDLEIRRMDQALRFTRSRFTQVGEGLVFEGEL